MSNLIADYQAVYRVDGGKGSGNFGHSGRPGMVGGSAGSGGSSGRPRKSAEKIATKPKGATAADSQKELNDFLDSRSFTSEYRNAEKDATEFENDNYYYFGHDKRKMQDAPDNFEKVVGKAREEVQGFYDSVPAGTIIKIHDPYASDRWDRSVYAAKFPDGRFAMNKDLKYMKSAIKDYNEHGVSLDSWMKDSGHCARETMRLSFEYDRGLDRPNFAKDRRPTVVDSVKISKPKKRKPASIDIEEEY